MDKIFSKKALNDFFKLDSYEILDLKILEVKKIKRTVLFQFRKDIDLKKIQMIEERQ